ncbi:hypothetical protein NUW54_g8338 [Trametes sanguinea]|uniref:Uncharacterized protein n=1 Tax=Trametes sanguinea TaxID=158606 RepID=A0ACC1PGU4_9APHY|nr:hypothetical protein NUW54_g8338 [Trametes sanguinea]
MVILAYRHQTARAHEKHPSVATEYESGPTTRSIRMSSSERSPEGLYTRHSVPSTHTRRALALSLTLTHWTPIQYQNPSEEANGLPGDILTGRIACPRSRAPGTILWLPPNTLPTAFLVSPTCYAPARPSLN